MSSDRFVVVGGGRNRPPPPGPQRAEDAGRTSLRQCGRTFVSQYAYEVNAVRARLLPLVLVLATASCADRSVDYQSRYVTPLPPNTAPVTSSVAPMQPSGEQEQASFVDNFNRPDTIAGIGDGWSMRGDVMRGDPMAPADDGFIRNGSFSYSGANTVYATREMRGLVEGIGTVGRFSPNGDGGETSIGLGISADSRFTANAIILTASRWGWQVRLRRNSEFQPVVMRGEFSPELQLDTVYEFKLAVAEDTITVQAPGIKASRRAPIDGLVGSQAFWMEYVERPPARVVFQYDAVWAAEEGQPLLPVDNADLGRGGS
jgi:hypothetical protein